MDLLQADVEACTKYVGSAVVEVPAGKTFKIETSPQGEDVLIFECEAGKKLTVMVSVAIEEEDE